MNQSSEGQIEEEDIFDEQELDSIRNSHLNASNKLQRYLYVDTDDSLDSTQSESESENTQLIHHSSVSLPLKKNMRSVYVQCSVPLVSQATQCGGALRVSQGVQCEPILTSSVAVQCDLSCICEAKTPKDTHHSQVMTKPINEDLELPSDVDNMLLYSDTNRRIPLPAVQEIDYVYSPSTGPTIELCSSTQSTFVINLEEDNGLVGVCTSAIFPHEKNNLRTESGAGTSQEKEEEIKEREKHSSKSSDALDLLIEGLNRVIADDKTKDSLESGSGCVRSANKPQENFEINSKEITPANCCKKHPEHKESEKLSRLRKKANGCESNDLTTCTSPQNENETVNTEQSCGEDVDDSAFMYEALLCGNDESTSVRELEFANLTIVNNERCSTPRSLVATIEDSLQLDQCSLTSIEEVGGIDHKVEGSALICKKVYRGKKSVLKRSREEEDLPEGVISASTLLLYQRELEKKEKKQKISTLGDEREKKDGAGAGAGAGKIVKERLEGLGEAHSKIVTNEGDDNACGSRNNSQRKLTLHNKMKNSGKARGYGRLYTYSEQKAIVNHIIDHNYYERYRGNTIWQSMERSKDFHGRTWQSLKEHFRKQIIKNIEEFVSDKRILNKFLAVRDS